MHTYRQIGEHKYRDNEIPGTPTYPRSQEVSGLDMGVKYHLQLVVYEYVLGWIRYSLSMSSTILGYLSPCVMVLAVAGTLAVIALVVHTMDSKR